MLQKTVLKITHVTVLRSTKCLVPNTRRILLVIFLTDIHSHGILTQKLQNIFHIYNNTLLSRLIC